MSRKQERADYVLVKVERDAALSLLRRLEWAGTIVFDEWYDKGRCCPVCRVELAPHDPDCELDYLLNRTTKTP